MGVLLGLVLALPTTAQSPQIEYEQQPTLTDIIQPPPAAYSTPLPTRPAQPSGRHPTKGKADISKLRLLLVGSPLLDYADLIAQSPYASTIIGICWIEQYHCHHAPNNNYWGIGPGKRYDSPSAGIRAISDLLAGYDTKGYDTIEKLNCYYVQPCSSNWLNTVLNVKAQLEMDSLPLQ